MMKRQINRVHGHSIPELERLLQEACDIFDNNVVLISESLGGWSNVNIRGESSGLNFILKLPRAISASRLSSYKQLYDISLFFHKIGISSRPLFLGNLPDSTKTPFIIFEYIEGIVHDSLSDCTSYEIAILKESHQILSKQKPPGLIQYNSPSDHLGMTHALVNEHEGISKCSQELAQLIDTFNEFYPHVRSFTDSLGLWPQTLMHGDLWIPNIVFQEGKLILLDFDMCAYGNHLFDIAYLLETPESITENIPPGLLLPEEEKEVNSLRPLVLAYLVGWSLERLLSTESGLVEPNIATPERRATIIEYIRSKMSRLKTILS